MKAPSALAAAMLAAGLLTLAGGCQAVDAWCPLRIPEDAHRHHAEVVDAFQQQRASAELLAAKSHFDEGDLPACRTSLEKILHRDPHQREALLLAAGVELSDHQAERARPYVETLLAQSPDDPEANYALGLICEAGGEPAWAAVYYRKAGAADGDSEVQPASYSEQAGHPPSAKQAASPPATKQDTAAQDRRSASSAAPHAERASASAAPHAEREEYEGAVRKDSAASAGGDNPPTADQLVARAEEALRRGDLDAARTGFQQAAALRPQDPQIPTAVAVAALRYNQPELAIELLVGAAQAFPKSAPVARTLGAAYYRVGDYESAQVALQQALSLDKSSPLTYFLVGCTLAKLGRGEAAEEYFHQARRLDPRYALPR